MARVSPRITDPRNEMRSFLFSRFCSPKALKAGLRSALRFKQTGAACWLHSSSNECRPDRLAGERWMGWVSASSEKLRALIHRRYRHQHPGNHQLLSAALAGVVVVVVAVIVEC